MTVSDEKDRDMNGFSKQKKDRILRTRGKTNTSRPSCRHKQAARLLPLTSPHASLPSAERPSSRKAAGPHLHYGTTAINIRTCMVSHYDTDENDRILTIGKYNDGY